MLDIQLGRRNLSPIQRIAIAEKYRSIYEKQAKKNQSDAGKIYGIGKEKLVKNSSQANYEEKERNPTVRKILSDVAGVSEDTYSKGKKILDSDDKVLKDLIETNIRQRGIGNPNPVKLGKCIKELERIYGIQHGATSFQGNQYNEVSPKVSESPTQEQLAEIIGISVDTLNNYKKLTELIPELEDLVETGILAPTTAIALVKYVELKGYKHGEIGNGREKTSHNENSKLSLDEIAKQLGISKANLTRVLSIERNLTDSMKELLDTGVITKTLVFCYYTAPKLLNTRRK